MKNEIVPSGKGGIIRVPEVRVLAMIASCVEQISKVESIADAREVTEMAEAIAAIARKVALSKEVKRAAVRLLVDAERKLGEITASIPRREAGHGKLKTMPRKKDVLTENGISRGRANLAERLHSTPQEKIDEVIGSGANTMHGIVSGLGLQTDGYLLRQKRASALAFLCEEAIALLDRSVKSRSVPHAGTVAEMVTRHKNITGHGNAKATWHR